MKKSVLTFGITLLAILFAVTAFGEYDSENMNFVSSLKNGPAISICVSGDYIFLGEGSSFVAVDNTDPENPVRSGSVYLPGLIEAICVRDNVGYIANGDLGVYTIDLEDPANPRIMGIADTVVGANDIISDGDFVYVTTTNYRVHILDVSDPYNPTEVWRNSTGENSKAITLYENYMIYVHSHDGLRIMDITDPTAPELVTSFDVMNICDLDVHDNKLFALSTSTSAKLKVFDLTDPASPVQTTDSLTYRPSDIFIRDGKLYCVGGDELIDIYDVTGSLTPYASLTGSSSHCFAQGDMAYTIGVSSGLSVIDISDADSLIVTGNLITGDGCYAVHAEDNMCYISAGTRSVTAVDVTNPEEPEIRGGFTDIYNTQGVNSRNDTVFVANGSRGFLIVDFTDPESPVLISENRMSGYVRDIDFYGNYALISDYTYGIIIFDISDPAAPVEAAVYDSPGRAYAVQIRDTLAYVADYNGGLIVLNITDPTAPVEVGIGDFSSVLDVTLYGDYAYLACDRAGLYIADISDPTAPVDLGRFGSSHIANGLDISENRLYVANVHGGVNVFDLTDPESPEECGYFRTQHYARDVFAVDSFCYVADQNGGAILLKYDAPVSTPFEIELNTGWSLIGYPFEEYFPTTFFPSSVIDPVYLYNPSTRAYDGTDELVPGKGHWILCDSDTSWRIVDLEAMDELTISIRTGWNLISGMYADMPVTHLSGYDDIILPIYGFDPETGGYFEADTLQGMKGYWILSADDFDIDLP